MIRKMASIGLAATAAAGLALLTPGTAYAAGISPADTDVVATSTDLTFEGTVFGLAFQVVCTNSTIGFTTPSSGYGPVAASPALQECTDTFGGTATIAVAPGWEISADATPQVVVSIPQNGAVFTTSSLPGCEITVAPNGPAQITASYDNSTGTASFTNSDVPFADNGQCGGISETGTATGTFVTSPTVTIT